MHLSNSQAFHPAFNLCSAAHQLSINQCRARDKRLQLFRCLPDARSAGGGESEYALAAPVISFAEGVNNVRCSAIPDGKADQNGIVIGKTLHGANHRHVFIAEFLPVAAGQRVCPPDVGGCIRFLRLDLKNVCSDGFRQSLCDLRGRSSALK